jgi:hypothetical protein
MEQLSPSGIAAMSAKRARVPARPPFERFSSLMANAVNATLYEKLNFDFIRDITPVAGILRVPKSWR